ASSRRRRQQGDERVRPRKAEQEQPHPDRREPVMTILGLGILLLVLFPLVAWANRPYRRYRRAYEEKFGISLHPELDAFYREAESGRKLDMLRLGPRVLVATLRSGRARQRDPALDQL